MSVLTKKTIIAQLRQNDLYIPAGLNNKNFLKQILHCSKKLFTNRQMLSATLSDKAAHINGTLIHSALSKEATTENWVPDSCFAGCSEYSVSVLNTMTRGSLDYCSAEISVRIERSSAADRNQR